MAAANKVYKPHFGYASFAFYTNRWHKIDE
jgi:hypothetical protein